MANFIKSKVQQSLSFLLMLVIAFSAFSGVLFVNPIPSYAYDLYNFGRALSGDKNLSEVDLNEANLNGANLSAANLNGVNLIGAKLSSAILSGADLYEAYLDNADLSYADLRYANLSGANLSGADLSGAITDSQTQFPEGFDAKRAGVIFK